MPPAAPWGIIDNTLSQLAVDTKTPLDVKYYPSLFQRRRVAPPCLAKNIPGTQSLYDGRMPVSGGGHPLILALRVPFVPVVPNLVVLPLRNPLLFSGYTFCGASLAATAFAFWAEGVEIYLVNLDLFR